MKILAVGDIVGENGLNKLKDLLPTIIEKENIDFTIVNAENTSGGMGLTDKDFNVLPVSYTHLTLPTILRV